MLTVFKYLKSFCKEKNNLFSMPMVSKRSNKLNFSVEDLG